MRRAALSCRGEASWWSDCSLKYVGLMQAAHQLEVQGYAHPSTWVSGATVWQSANPCKRGLDPCKWIFRAERVWMRGRGGRGGVNPGNTTAERHWFVYIDRPVEPHRSLCARAMELTAKEGCSLQERPYLSKLQLAHRLVDPFEQSSSKPINQSFVRSDPKSDNPGVTDQQQ